jgi:hypothetical protein
VNEEIAPGFFAKVPGRKSGGVLSVGVAALTLSCKATPKAVAISLIQLRHYVLLALKATSPTD